MKLSVRLAALALCVPALLHAQSYGIMDSHFRGVLFPEVYKDLASTKINYPGLWVARGSGAAVGAQPGRFLPGEGFGGIYGWADFDIDPASAGFWLGNFNYGNYYWDIYDGRAWEYTVDAQVFTLDGAFWGTPQNNAVFKGISAVFGVDNDYWYDGNELGIRWDTKRLSLAMTALVRISENYHLRGGFYIRNNYIEDPTAITLDDARLFTDGIFAGLVDGKMRTLDLRAENTFAMDYLDQRKDTLTVGLRFSQGWAHNYRKHILFTGVKAEAAVRIISDISEEAGSFWYLHFLQNMTDEGRVMRFSASAPVILDMNVYGPLWCILSVNPGISYTHINTRDPQHAFTMDISGAELSFKGLIGKNVDFALKPTLDNDVFISALEIRYRF